MKSVQKGFTLIELMIVVAIIGILAAVAIPQYQQYTMKAKLGNAMTAVSSVQTAIAECLQEQGGVGTTCYNNNGGVPADSAFTATNEVKSITTTGVANGQNTIVATLNDALSTAVAGATGATITWTAQPGGSAVTWGITTSITNPTYSSAITKNSTS